MKRKTRKVLAAVMVCLLAVTMLPSESLAFLHGSFVAKAADSVNAAYSFNADELDAAALAGGLDTAIAEDKTIGTDGYFTLMSMGGKVKISKPGKLSCGINDFQQCVYLTGGLKASGQAGIKVTVPEGKNAQVTIFASAKSTSESKLKYFDAAGTGVDIAGLEFENVQKYKVKNLGAGTYYFGGSNGAFVCFMEVKYTDVYTLDPNDASTFDAVFDGSKGDMTVNTTVGTDDFFELISTGAKIKNPELNLSFNGEQFAKALRLDGGAKTSGQACFKISVKENARVTILAAGKNDKGSKLEYVKVGGDAFTTFSDGLVKEQIGEYVLEDLEPGDYYIGSDQGGDIFKVVVEYTESYTLDPNDASTFDAVFDGSKGDMTVNTTVGTDDFFELISTGAKIKNPELNLSFNGEQFAKALRLDGGAKTSGQACFKISVKENARVTILAAGKNDKGSKLEFVKVGGDTFTTFSDGLVKEQITEYVLEDLLPGDYYIGSDQGADIFKVVVEYDSSAQKAADWSTVAAPVINSVTNDAEGNFVVDFTAVIDKVKGAENVRVTMLEGGCEVETINVKSQISSVTFQPLWSGNYEFVAVAQRTGEADKPSNVVKSDGYVLAVKKPVITWAQNKGNGDVYLDWVNIPDANTYAVAYKEAGTDTFTYVEKALSADDAAYTLKGLTPDKTYTIRVEAKRASDGFVSFDEKDITVTADADQKWYVATTGSAQQTNATVTQADGTVKEYVLDARDTASNKTNNEEAVSIVNTTGSIEMAGQTSGKISDDEDGFSYYYTKIDPDTENFKISATFEITDTALTPDNQTGFGIIAADTLGINNWGAPDYVHKYFNYASSMLYSSKSSSPVMRMVSGYQSSDTSNNDGAERVVNNSNFSGVASKFEVGTKYTFTLEKTNEGYTATCNGVEQKFNDNSFTSVQEDGTVCVGFAVSRKVSVKITDTKFEKSASTGITAPDAGSDKITPSGRVYSSGTCGAAEYEYIYVPNCAGTITVTGPDGVVVSNKAVKGNEVVRVNVPIKTGSNEIKSTFVPAAAENITSTKPLENTTKVNCVRYGKEGETIIVSADGKADGDGTEEKPLDLATAVRYAQPGQVIFLKDGIYKNNITIERSVSGTADKNITMVAENVSTNGQDGVVFEGAGLTIVGSYWHVYGLYVKDAPGVGIQVSGNYNTVDMCTVNHSGNSGVQISRSGGADNEAGRVGKLWPTGNLIKNCESFNNCDKGRNDADGFAAKLTCGDGNKFYGCIGHNNIDDGWDLYAKSISGEIGAVTIENCVAYNNGWLTTDDTTAADYKYGEGNGFKLGGGYLKGGHVLKNSITFNNHGKGITSNSCPDCQIINCISYNNSINQSQGAYNVGLNTKASNKKEWVVDGLISLNNKDNTDLEDLIPFSLHSAKNYIYDGNASYNNQGVQALDDWFVSVDVTKLPTRNANGTIAMGGLLELKDTAPADTGARLDITSEAAISVKPEKTTIVSPDTENPETPDVPGEETDTNIDVSKNQDVVTGAEAEKDTVIVDENNSSVANSDVELRVEAAKDENVSKLNDALANQGIKLPVGTNLKYYDINLFNKADGKMVKMNAGNIKLTFAYEEGIDYNNIDVVVYRLTESGEVEVLNAERSEGSFAVTTKGLGSFVVAYVPKDTTTEPTNPTEPSTPAEPPKTGDSSRMAVYGIAGFVSILALGYLYLDSKKRKTAK